MLSAQLPKPASASGTGFVRNGVGSPGLAARVASHVATSAGCQFTVMAPPSEGPLAEWLLPVSGSGVQSGIPVQSRWTPSCSPVSRLSSAPMYNVASCANAAAEPSGAPVETVGGVSVGLGF